MAYSTAALALGDGAWLGLQVRDISGACIVANVLPGPLNGTGLMSPSVCRPDLLESIDGAPASAASLARIVGTKSPGEPISLTYRPCPTRSWRIPLTADSSAAPVTIEVILSSAIDFMGPWGSPSRASGHFPSPTATTGVTGTWLDGARKDIEAFGLAPHLEQLCAAFAARTTAHPDALAPPLVAQILGMSLDEPLGARVMGMSLDAPRVARWLLEPTSQTTNRPQHTAATLIARALGATPPATESQGALPFNGPMSPVFAMDFLLSEPRLRFAAHRADPEQSEAWMKALAGTAAVASDGLVAHPELVNDACRALRMSTKIDPQIFVDAMKHLDVSVAPELDLGAMDPIMPLPEELTSAVSGPVILAEQVDGLGWVVVGTGQDNTYDMGRIAAVFDPGGNDTYRWSGIWIGGQGVIDLKGNDRYFGCDAQGPAAGLLGLSFVDDRSGDDTYRGGSFACGAGLSGCGLLIDHEGNDTYECGAWSLGAAFVGAGMLMDLKGDDIYRGGAFCQGCGGPGGVGALIDCSGDDIYESGRHTPSVHDIGGAWASFSQGAGFGLRHYAAGGIGVLSDRAGNDQYSAGEHSQGAGYFRALGVLHDSSGRDRYNGDHYSQGAGVHDAVGILLEDDGDDVYEAGLSAAQGCAWDFGIGILLETAGNDQYRGDILCQGSAAQQAIASLIDLEGSDHYLAASSPCQGESGTNEYHFAESGALSFSLLYDTGGKDFFSNRTAGGTPRLTGQTSKPSPAASTLYGLFVDR